jgi:DNA-binding transcriptional regulator YiaG/DNA-binding MarR family transcriptional regulator
MTLTELRYIVTLAREQHFGRAAEKCFVSQPTLSIAVKKLEEELNVALFERSKNAVRLTDVGQRIVEQAQKVLQQADTIKDLAQFGKDQLKSPLRVGAIYTIGPYLFPHLVPEVRKIAPDMPLYIEENFTARLREKLRNGELDAIIIALPFEEPDVVTRVMYDELLASVKEMDDIVQGKSAPAHITEFKDPEVKKIREQVGLSQNRFALLIGVSKRTLENWEQGRRQPTGPAKALLRILAADPEGSVKALHKH